MRAMKILIIMQRANGDVFLTLPLIRALQLEYPNARIDMLVNDDTLGIAKTLPHINQFIVFSYAQKKAGLRARLSQERDIIRKIWRQYDLSINLTASDRSVQYAIMASKNTYNTIPMCHNILLSSAKIEFETDDKNSLIKIKSTVKTTGKTGVEMEALMMVSVAGLTIYDMCKAIDKGMIIGEIKLEEKLGGKSGVWKREEK